MSFEKIGPFTFSRLDLVLASLVISFAAGARSVRVKSVSILIAGVVAATCTVFTGQFIAAGAIIGGELGLFILGPAFRSRKESRHAYLSYSPDGVVVETNNVRTLYKWATVGSYWKFGTRLLIVISDGRALVIAERFTDRPNMAKLTATLDDHSTSV